MISFIIMDWSSVVESRSRSCGDYDRFLETFLSHGYTPTEIDTADGVIRRANLDANLAWNDIIWVLNSDQYKDK